MTDKYKPLREACDQLKAEATTQGAVNPRSQLILELLADYDAAIGREEQLLTQLKAQADDAELMDLINTRRISVEHEYEGPTIASIWGDEPDAIATGEGTTAQEAIRAALAKEATLDEAGGDQ